jgi:N-carbamoylputrescine amidase
VQEARTLRAAAVQMVSANGDVEGNLEHATAFVEEAVGRRAKLVVLPEFMPNGYIYDKNDMWDTAEGPSGPTLRWLKETSSRLGIWLGAGFLEAEGEDFFLSFVITAPDGSISGRVRKQTPAFAEAFFIKGETSPHVIDTELGKIGVGICYENHLAYMPHLMFSQHVDLMLMVHSSPTPMPNPLYPARAVEKYDRDLKELAGFYARMLGVPVVSSNKCGEWRSPLPLLPFLAQESNFTGFSTIADSDGSVKAQLQKEEGAIVEDVTLDPARKTGTPPECSGHWSHEVPWQMNQFRLFEFMGGLSYRFSGKRKRRAREISSR